MGVVTDIQFDSLDEARLWYSFFNQSPGQLCNPAFVSDGAQSRIEIDIAPQGSTIAQVQNSFDAVDQWYLDDNPSYPFYAQNRVLSEVAGSQGNVVNCYDPDPTKRGRYIWNVAQARWVRDTWQVLDKCWPDNNHSERLLEIILGSWIRSAPYPPGSGGHMAWKAPPGNNDWRNAKITFDMRCTNLTLGPWAKICQHVQGAVPRQTWPMKRSATLTRLPVATESIRFNGFPFTFQPGPGSGPNVQIGTTVAQTTQNLLAALTTVSDPLVAAATYALIGTDTIEVTTKPASAIPAATFFEIEPVKHTAQTTQFATVVPAYAYPNFLFTKQLISDQLGFGNDSWGKRNKVGKILDSGRVAVVLEFTANDSDWECLGGCERPLTFFNYVVTPIAELLRDLRGNSYMLAVHPKPQPDADAFKKVTTGIAEHERIGGKIMVYGIKVEVP